MKITEFTERQYVVWKLKLTTYGWFMGKIGACGKDISV